MLDALASFVERVDFDFVINLSDTDLALRTNAEMVAFLTRFKGRSMLPAAVPQPHSYRRFLHEEMGGIAAIECGGFGFVTINTSALRLTPERPCCFGRSGPMVHGAIPYTPLRPGRGETLYAGSPWAILAADFARYLVLDPEAHRWSRIFERRLLPDEARAAPRPPAAPPQSRFTAPLPPSLPPCARPSSRQWRCTRASVTASSATTSATPHRLTHSLTHRPPPQPLVPARPLGRSGWRSSAATRTHTRRCLTRARCTV